MLDVPHLHITLTIDDILRPFFHADRSLLKLLLKVAAQAVCEVIDDIYPGPRIGMVYVDFKTQKRTIKDSGRWFADVIQKNGFTVDTAGR